MEHLTFHLKDIVYLLGLICSFYAVYKIANEIYKPSKEMKAKVDEYIKYSNKHLKQIKNIETTNILIIRTLLVIIDHEINGNNTEKLKQIKQEIQDYYLKH